MERTKMTSKNERKKWIFSGDKNLYEYTLARHIQGLESKLAEVEQANSSTKTQKQRSEILKTFTKKYKETTNRKIRI